MELHSYLSTLFQYDDWANREVITALQSVPHSPQKAVRLMAHIVAVEYLWLARLKQEYNPPVWPDWTTTEVAQRQQDFQPAINHYLGTLSADRLTQTVSYTNSKGERWTNTAADILMHAVMHSAYHRGQIAMVLRDTGIAPPYTDFIQAVRAHHIEE